MLDTRGTARPSGTGRGADRGWDADCQSIARRRAARDLVRLIDEARQVLTAGGDPVVLAHKLHAIGAAAVVVASRGGLRPAELVA